MIIDIFFILPIPFFFYFLYLNNLIDITRCNEVLNILPYQLLKSNRKFQYGLMRTGGRSKDYEKALEFLSANGIAYKCYKISVLQFERKSTCAIYRRVG